MRDSKITVKSIFLDQVGMSALSPTPLPTSSTTSLLNRPMSAMSQPTGGGYHMLPGALPLPGMASTQAAYLAQVIHNFKLKYCYIFIL